MHGVITRHGGTFLRRRLPLHGLQLTSHASKMLAATWIARCASWMQGVEQAFSLHSSCPSFHVPCGMELMRARRCSPRQLFSYTGILIFTSSRHPSEEGSRQGSPLRHR